MAMKPQLTAASPPTLTPADSAAPRLSAAPIRPSMTPTSAASPIADTPPCQASLTSREWVVPPRPKPGRKPATDTPPTKRKAQNRAAQRAFRERRAARVGELEEQMKQMEDEDEQEQKHLRNNIERLESEIDRYRTDLELWIEKCRRLEQELASEREGKNFDNSSRSQSTTTVPLPRKTSTRQDVPENQLSSLSGTSDVVMGCGNCTPATHCQCIDEAFNVLGAADVDASDSSSSKRPHSPLHPDSHKRIKAETPNELEIDFTSAFASHEQGPGISEPSAGSPTDPCGFCQDGTPCICAEMAAEDARDQAAAASSLHNAAMQQSSRVNLMPGVSRLSRFTPPPSDGDVASLPKSLLQSAASNTCASGPGSCKQCRADPNSTVFCQALAASRSFSVANQAGCCGASSSAGGCCQSQSQSGARRTTRSSRAIVAADSDLVSTSEAVGQNLPGITLTCADAYTTLSRHPGYEMASGDIASWMPKLYANATSDKQLAGRPAMEIDAANVMSVLKDFDRRFAAER